MNLTINKILKYHRYFPIVFFSLLIFMTIVDSDLSELCLMWLRI